MKKLIATLLITAIATMTNMSVSAQCTDIKTKKITSFLNREIKPRLDLKLDKNDGFLAIRGKRQNFSVPVITVSPISRKWTYHFENVRRMDSNFFYDSRTNSIALDIKFENDGPELKGLCPGCIKMSRDRRAPDVNWGSPNILRIFLKPIIYQNSVSFSVSDIKLIGAFSANGVGNLIPGLTKSVTAGLKSEMIKLFRNGETQRLFNDAIKPLLNSNNVSRSRSVTLAASSLRVCK